MKRASQHTDFLYALMDKGYLKANIKADALRYKARTTVERTNSELKDGFLSNKIYRRGSHARYDIELAILMTTMKKAWKMMQLKEEAKTIKVS